MTWNQNQEEDQGESLDATFDLTEEEHRELKERQAECERGETTTAEVLLKKLAVSRTKRTQ